MSKLSIDKNKKLFDMKKPEKPVEPRYADFDREPISNIDTPFITAYKKYQKDMMKYKEDVYLYEQLKFIKFIKAADVKLILKKYKIKKL